MKLIILSLLSLGSFSLMPGCTYVEKPAQTTQTTRTTTDGVSPTTYGTVETKTTRTY